VLDGRERALFEVDPPDAAAGRRAARGSALVAHPAHHAHDEEALAAEHELEADLGADRRRMRGGDEDATLREVVGDAGEKIVIALERDHDLERHARRACCSSLMRAPRSSAKATLKHEASETVPGGSDPFGAFSAVPATTPAMAAPATTPPTAAHTYQRLEPRRRRGDHRHTVYDERDRPLGRSHARNHAPFVVARLDVILERVVDDVARGAYDDFQRPPSPRIGWSAYSSMPCRRACSVTA